MKHELPSIPVLLEALHAGHFSLKRYNTACFFLRHAHATVANGKHDSHRRISSRGKKQCAFQKLSLKKVGGVFDAIFRSPLRRTLDTFEELGGNSGDITVIEELITPTGENTRQSGVLDAAHEILGAVGLGEIFKHREVAEAMDIFAGRALIALMKKLQTLPNWSVERTTFELDDKYKLNILIIGHGWFNPILAYYLAGLNEKARRHLLNHPMGECEIFEVGLDAAGNPIWNSIPCPAC